MPRLSVDLDLVFPDYALPREQALARINEAIRQMADHLQKGGFQTHIPVTAAGDPSACTGHQSTRKKVLGFIKVNAK